jgi:RimJ/RimL family protein N-acetyltransferase
VDSDELALRSGGVQNWAEEFVYRLNERGHWLFRLYDWSNELFAALRFGSLRRRASTLDVPLQIRIGLEARIRFLHSEDEDAFADLCASFDARYQPPHLLDRVSVARALRRRSYLPFGIFVEGELVGYLLLRLFYPSRAVTGIWTLPDTHNRGLGQEALKQTAAFTHSEGLPDYATIPIDNENSVRMANAAGWKVIRVNSRFHVLRWNAEYAETYRSP